MTLNCIGCGAVGIKELIHLGPQPPSNRYLSGSGESCETHPIRFGYCPGCGLGQLLDPMSPDVVRSKFDWITYNEPEGHLDDLVGDLSDRIGCLEQSRVVGVTYKDDSTLERFRRQGVQETYRLNQADDLGLQDPLASLESIQNVLIPETAAKIAARIGLADLVMVRHILEHAHQPLRLLESCQLLCKPGGLLVFEVPDCRKVLDGHDHCFLWEEHISYFTPTTLRGFLERAGLADTEIKIYPYPMEDSLIAVVRNRHSSSQSMNNELAQEVSRLESFAGSFASRGTTIRTHLKELQARGRRVALFGAGHLAAKFINFYNLAPYLSGVIDDNPNKLGRFMPGSKLPIIGSDFLEKGEIDLCLLTLNPESEQKMLKAKAGYLARGGRFRSVFSASPNSIDQDIADD